MRKELVFNIFQHQFQSGSIRNNASHANTGKQIRMRLRFSITIELYNWSSQFALNYSFNPK